jgi:3-phosphoshikimate 1-carboxyvinyltransferase
MKVIAPAEVKGSVKAPPSKSATIRAVTAALLADGVSDIINPSFCDDATASLAIARALGGFSIRGKDRILMNGNRGFERAAARPDFIDCGESGLCVRMFPPVAALAGHDSVIGGTGSLNRRTVAMVESLRSFGVTCATSRGYPPVAIHGRLHGGTAHIDGSVSSQFLTGLLMALPLCHESSEVSVENLASKPYIEMTLAMAETFGIVIDHDETMKRFHIAGGQHYHATPVAVEADWSGASFLLVAGAIAGSVSVEGLAMNSCQADRAVLSALDAAGASCYIGEGSVTVERNDLKPFEFDAKDCPDLVPPLVALASHCPGKSTIHGTGRLAHKESDRAAALAREFGRMGITVNVEPDRIEIRGSRPGGARVDSHHDHRIAMACAVAALGAEAPVTITGPGCITKSYGGFFDDLESIRSSHE